MMIHFYYGLSGTLKSTTIKAKTKNKNISILPSLIKPWKRLETGLFKNKVEINDLNYACLHLVNLEELLKKNKGEDIYIERGVSDMLFYKNLKKKLSPDFIKSVIEDETKLCEKFEVKKHLISMEDLQFIANVTLKNEIRSKCFKDFCDYLDKQEEYIRFTEEYNNIDELIIISKAKDYLEKLNLDFDYKNFPNYPVKL